MLTVHKLWDAPGPTLGRGYDLGTAETVDELHDLLRDRTGRLEVVGARTVTLDLEAPLSADDRQVVEQIAGRAGSCASDKTLGHRHQLARGDAQDLGKSR